jgi:hypothetical protein
VSEGAAKPCQLRSSPQHNRLLPGRGSPVAGLIIFAAVGKTNYLPHLHVHRPFATRGWLNLLLDLSMGLIPAAVLIDSRGFPHWG